MTSYLARVAQLLVVPGALRAFVSWPKFSLAAFSIVSRMKRSGVSPATVIDVGANTGQFAVASTKLFDGAKVIPIEPDPRVAETLRRNLGPLAQDQVIVAAVGDVIGTADFFVNRDSQVSSLLQLGPDRIASFPKSTVAETIRVPLSTLDALFTERHLPTPILLKLDVQGFEDRVLVGARQFLERVEWILMEVSFSDLYIGESNFESLSRTLMQYGFQFTRPMNFHISPKTGEIIEMDALFSRLPAHSHPNVNL